MKKAETCRCYDFLIFSYYRNCIYIIKVRWTVKVYNFY
jgi:hypothetical protein